MLRSKSRSGSVDFGQKSHYSSSLFSRTLSSAKLCRGDATGLQIDSNALKSVDTKPSKIANKSENRINRIMSMQQQTGELDDELKRTKEKLSLAEAEKYRAFDQLKEAKKETHEANVKANESLTMEIEKLKEMLRSSREELKMKDGKIDSLENELGKTRAFEAALAEKDASLDKLNNELRYTREKEREMIVLISEDKKKIQELEAKGGDASSSGEEIEGLRLELQMTQENEKKALLDMEMLKNELKLAIEAEEKSAKAMEDLALALKEVAMESNQAKEKLEATQNELELVKEEAEQLKAIVRTTEERYQKLLLEVQQEADLHRNTADRLRVEAEETLFAWNGKEMGFVSCIKREEEEKATAQHECNKLAESLKAAENMTRAAREETCKLRDILKQAVSEANAAKAAAGIAREENSLLKDCLAEKEESLLFLTQENERLRINEATALENIKEFKRLLSMVPVDLEELKTLMGEESEENRKMEKSFSFCFEDLKFMVEPDEEAMGIMDEDPVKEEALKGSIFDPNAETPKSEPRTPVSVVPRQREYISPFTDDGDSDHLGSSANGDSDTDRHNGSHRKMRTMFRRVGDLLAISMTRKPLSIHNA